MTSTKTVVLTGGTNGIGLLVGKELARRGEHLIMLARNTDKAQAIRSEIQKETPGAIVDIFYSDFARLETVTSAVASINERFTQVDVLINNAGVHAFSQRLTEDGFAEMLSVNYLAPWLLTNKLGTLLDASKHARVVTVASEASRHGGSVNPDNNLTDTAQFTRRKSMELYGKTKLMNIMFSIEFARRMRGTNVSSNCLDPGFNATGIGRELPFSGPILRILNTLGIGNPKQGADIIIQLAADPDFSSVTGQYFSRRAEPIVPTGDSANPAARLALWNATEQLLKKFI